MEHTIEIKKIIHGGDGLGHLDDGMVVMTPFVLPGERVAVREIKRTKQYVRALPLDIISPSERRITPPCPYYGLCGGCRLQHVEYSDQLMIKSSLVEETFSRTGVMLPPTGLRPAVRSPLQLGYRHKIRLHLDTEGRIGFHRAGSNQVIEIDQCLLATDTINRSLKALRSSGFSKKSARHWKALELISCPETSRITLVLHPRSKSRTPSPPGVLAEIADFVLLRDSRILRQAQPITITGDLRQRFNENLAPGYTLAWDAHCFFQVNARLNDMLVHHVRSALRDKAVGPLLDLYCGIGNFSIPLARDGWEVTGVEHNRRSIRWARYNAKILSCTNAAFLCADVGETLSASVQSAKRYQTLVLDPPRQGLGKRSASEIVALGPQNIIYISCDPATLSRDLSVLTDGGYTILEAVLFDMFPQTSHIESVVVLEKN